MRPRVLLILVAIVAAAGAILWLMQIFTTDAPRAAKSDRVVPPTSSTAATTTPAESAKPEPTASTTAVAPPPSPSPVAPSITASAPAPPLDLATAAHTVDTQLQLLREGRDAEFRATFLPGVRVDDFGIAACKKRIEQVPVRPDWETAQDALDEDGHPVRRVSMFGKAMTGFHEVSGKWLSDGMWCVPIGLP